MAFPNGRLVSRVVVIKGRRSKASLLAMAWVGRDVIHFRSPVPFRMLPPVRFFSISFNVTTTDLCHGRGGTRSLRIFSGDSPPWSHHSSIRRVWPRLCGRIHVSTGSQGHTQSLRGPWYLHLPSPQSATGPRCSQLLLRLSSAASKLSALTKHFHSCWGLFGRL